MGEQDVKVMMVAMMYDYGDPGRGESYEYFNFYDSLQRMGHEVVWFDYMDQIRRLGKAGMNQALVQAVRDFAPDVAMFSLFGDQLLPETVTEVNKLTKTLCFFHDDTWRREFSQFWAGHFHYFTSADFEAPRKYQRLGLDHIIHFPFGCNEALYKPIPVEKKYDVSFVGGWHPYRDWIIKRLRKANIDVAVAGYRWPRGILQHPDMVRYFSESKINLNLSNSASWDARYLIRHPRALANLLRSPKGAEQIKARHFEINGCGGFQLSYYVDGLEHCYEIGKEIAVYLSPDDLIDRIRYYLKDDELRESIALAGYRRTLKEHTFKQRFERVFASMGLPASSIGGQGA
jgi:spore maturation protein CgeB